MARGSTKVLLKEHIPNLGAEADVVAVKRGYARNFLIPQGKAMELNPRSLQQVEALKRKRAEREAAEKSAAETLAESINAMSLSMELATGEQGKAFGSITSSNIYDELSKHVAELPFDRHQLELDRPIKNTGNFEVPVRIHSEVTAVIHLTVHAKAAAAGAEKAVAEAEAALEEENAAAESPGTGETENTGAEQS